MSGLILAPLDGSPESERILPYARLLCQRCGHGLELLRAFEPLGEFLGPALAELANEVLNEERVRRSLEQYLDSKAAELGDVVCRTTVERGHPADAILSHAEQADLIVIGRHGRSGLGRWLLGGTTAKVVRGSLKPVLVIPGETSPSQAKLDTIMVCVDGSPPAGRALDEAARLARALPARLFLYHAVPLMGAGDPEGDLIAARELMTEWEAKYPDLVATTLVQPTALSDHIAQSALELKVDMVAMGSHGRGGLARWLLGSAAESALQRVSVPLLVVH